MRRLNPRLLKQERGPSIYLDIGEPEYSLNDTIVQRSRLYTRAHSAATRIGRPFHSRKSATVLATIDDP